MRSQHTIERSIGSFGLPRFVQVGQRHFSHLLMVYPLHLESWLNSSAAQQATIQKSVDHWVSLCQPKDGAKVCQAVAICD